MRASAPRAAGLPLLAACLASWSCWWADPCPPGEHLDEDLDRCVPSVAAGVCPGGTSARLGKDECMPVGPLSCPAGFERARDGWGCEPIVPSEPCDMGWIARLGRGECERIASCDGAFPPAGATHVVTNGGDAAGLPVYPSVRAAVDAAPQGAVIAIDEGMWLASLLIDKSVTLVGRCAERTVLTTGGASGYRVLAVGGGAEVEVRGITIGGSWLGVVVIEASRFTLRESAIEAVADIALALVGEDVVGLVEDSVVRDVTPLDPHGWGISAALGARLVMRRSEVSGAVQLGVVAMDDGYAEIEDSLIFGHSQRGVGAQDVAEMSLLRTAVLDNGAGGVFADGSETRLTVRDSVIARNRSGPNGEGNGLTAQNGAVLEMSGTTVRGNERLGVLLSGSARVDSSVVVGSRPHGLAGGPERSEETGRGIEIADEGFARLVDSAVVDNTFIGIAQHSEAQLELETSLVGSTRRSSLGDFGYGMTIKGSAVLEDVTVQANKGVGVFVIGGHLRSTGLFVHDTRPSEGAAGFGIIAGWDQSGRRPGRMDVAGGRVTESAELALAFASRSSGLIQASFIEDNRVAIHVQENVSIIEGASNREPEAGEVLIDPDTVFRRNDITQGSGALVLPDLPTTF